MRHQPRLIQKVTVLFAMCVAAPASGQTLTPTQDLSFGAFVAGTGGTITITPQGARTATADVTLMTVGQIQASPASLEVNGSPGGAYTILLPADNVVTLAGSNGGSMAVNAFSSSPADQGQLSSTGTQTLAVGATLAVAASQTPGGYSGSFSVTVFFE